MATAMTRWLVDRDGRRFRNIPLNLADRRELLRNPITLRRHRKLNKLEAEFDTLWEQGVVYEDGLPRTQARP